MTSTFVPKGWGYEEWIVNTPLYCGKRLHVWKGKTCSLHFHKEKDETFYVQSGRILLAHAVLPQTIQHWLEDESFFPLVAEWFDQHSEEDAGIGYRVLNAGDSFRVPRLMLHRFTAKLPTDLFEFSTEHKDSDSYRVIKGD